MSEKMRTNARGETAEGWNTAAAVHQRNLYLLEGIWLVIVCASFISTGDYIGVVMTSVVGENADKIGFARWRH